MKVDFTQDELKVSFPNPIYANKPKTGEELIIKKAIVRRLYAPDLSALKRAIQKAQHNSGGSFDTQTADSQFAVIIYEILNVGIVSFILEDGTEVPLPKSSLMNKLTLSSALKVALWVMMLTKESSFISTSYKCKECNHTSIFDLDPDFPIPKDIEEDRGLMEDFLEFFDEKVNTAGKKGFNYTFSSPYKIVHFEEDEKGNNKPIQLTNATFRWPTLGDYVSAANTAEKRTNPDIWALYDSLLTVNEFNEEDTKKIKKENTAEKMMRMKLEELPKIFKEIDKYGITTNHKFTCLHCGSEIETPFDYTNFFGFLTS